MDIIGAIGSLVQKEFSETVYLEAVKQGIQQPCFFIYSDKSEITRASLGRFIRKIYLKLQYIPDKNAKRAQTENIGTRLCGLLAMFSAGPERYRGENMSWRIEEGNRLYFSMEVSVIGFYEQSQADTDGALMEVLNYE